MSAKVCSSCSAISSISEAVLRPEYSFFDLTGSTGDRVKTPYREFCDAAKILRAFPPARGSL